MKRIWTISLIVLCLCAVGCAGISPITAETYLDATEEFTRSGIESATVTDVNGNEIPISDEDKQAAREAIDAFRGAINAAKGRIQ